MHDETQVLPPTVLTPPPQLTSETDTAPERSPSEQHAETLAQTPGATARGAAAIAPHAVIVPGYEIIGELGRGGMGVVYKARHLKLNRIVALKMVLNAQHTDSRELGRFLLEAEAVAAIRHPYVIQVYDSGEVHGRPYMAMECLEGGSLISRVRSGGKMAPRHAAELLLKIARGVQAAHDRGIVHRDLKPHNVLLDTPPPGSAPGTWGEPKVTDFGLAKRGGASDLTQTGAVMGTPAYMAPEQARGETKNVGPLSDVYALGVILYECLTGTVPFAGEDAWSVIRQVISVEPEPVTRRVAGVPRDLDLICRKCLAKEPSERYSSAGALADDLQRFLLGEAIRGPRTDLWYATQRAVRRYWRPVAVVLLLLLLLVISWLLPSPLD
jgi:serine/threonine protein kinase